MWHRAKAYKNRLKKWGADKKAKEHEMVAVLRKKTERMGAGKTSAFTLHGRPVDLAKVDQYLRRKGISVRDVLCAENARPGTPLGLRCFTPEPLGSSVVTPESLRVPERIYASIKDMHRAYFEMPASIRDHCSHGFYHEPGPTPSLVTDWYAANGEELEITLFMESLERYMTDQTPHCDFGGMTMLMNQFFDLLVMFVASGLDDSILLIMSRLSQVTRHLTPTNPRRLLLTNLETMSPAVLGQIVLKAWRCSLDETKAGLGYLQIAVVICEVRWLVACARLGSAAEIVHVRSKLNRMRSDFRGYGLKDERTLAVLAGLADAALINDDLQAASSLGGELVFTARLLPEHDDRPWGDQYLFIGMDVIVTSMKMKLMPNDRVRRQLLLRVPCVHRFWDDWGLVHHLDSLLERLIQWGMSQAAYNIARVLRRIEEFWGMHKSSRIRVGDVLPLPSIETIQRVQWQEACPQHDSEESRNNAVDAGHASSTNAGPPSAEWHIESFSERSLPAILEEDGEASDADVEMLSIGHVSLLSFEDEVFTTDNHLEELCAWNTSPVLTHGTIQG